MTRKTAVSIKNENWLINGKLTYEGRTFRDWKIEGWIFAEMTVRTKTATPVRCAGADAIADVQRYAKAALETMD